MGEHTWNKINHKPTDSEINFLLDPFYLWTKAIAVALAYFQASTKSFILGIYDRSQTK